ncbi:MAG: hypothetical protein IPJ61_15230 [Tessaracoccus sp.]|uniref:hypothetical protein n=1 Tax=Tessaracoccus sp. TaxID=1971211 RepID=UPI001ECD5407|nr:hypothetical protein [Tessaracoccus sp.]MBK7822368.1 hypothetical protein [Tessaracoccus sp.]
MKQFLGQMRRRLRRHAWAAFTVALFLVAAGLGLAGWLRHGLGFWDALYRTMGLFVIDGEAVGEINGLLAVARFAAPLATASGIVAIVLRALSGQWAMWRAKRSTGHVILLGGGAEAAELAIRYREDHPVVVVGDTTAEDQAELRAARVRWVTAAGEAQLRRIVDGCWAVVVTAPDDQAASSLTGRVRELNRALGQNPTVITVVDSRDVAVDWRHSANDHVICRSEQVARSVLRACPPFEEGRVSRSPLVLGNGRLAAELVARIFEGWQQPGESITVHCGGPDEERAFLVERGLTVSGTAPTAAPDGPQGMGTLRWHPLPSGTHLAPQLVDDVLSEWEVTWLAYSKRADYQTGPASVFVAYDDDTVTLTVANAIRRALGDRVIVVAVPQNDGLARHLRAPGVICHPQEELLRTPSQLNRTLATDLAEELVAELGRWPDDVPSLFGHISREPDQAAVLAEQSDDVRRGVEAVSGEIRAVVERAGFDVVSAPLPSTRVTVLTPTELSDVARALDARVPRSPGDVTPWERRTRLLELAGRLPALLNRAGRALVRERRTVDPISLTRLRELAQLTHAGYRELADRTRNATGSAYADMAWRRLPELVQSSNVAQVLDIPVKLALLGVRLTRTSDADGRAYAFTADDIELLAYEEHRRWAHFHIRNGRHSHNWNIPWDVLPDEVREYDRQVVRRIPLLLEEAGLVMVTGDADPDLPPAPELGPPQGRFRRVGRVRAMRLTAPRSWATARGDELRGEAGDWWVQADDDTDREGRSVTPEAFARTYLHLEGDRYERVSTVHARQVRTREVIPTTEGPSTAEPGDWVITDDVGVTWPVPADGFATLYQPVGVAPRS